MKKVEKLLIAGGTGLIGQRLVRYLPPDKYKIYILTRNPIAPHDNVTYLEWDLHNQEIDYKAVRVDHIINLTGAGIADKRWSAERKKILIDSRIQSLQLINHALQQTGHRPSTIISASAIGYYGDRSAEILSESSEAGKGFLAECCKLWEEAARDLATHTERLNILRIGIVLSMHGGALPKILMTKNARILNYFGSGEQYYSWIHIDDICKMIYTIISDTGYSGIYNAVAPLALRNKEFVAEVGDGLNGKYILLPVPAFGLRLAMGEMADVVLNSNRVLPYRLQSAGFEFDHENLREAIRHLVETKI